MTQQKDIAVIKTGGKQYVVAEGDVLKIEKLEAKEGDKISFDEVLLSHRGGATKVGTPTTGEKVEAEVLEQGKGKKISVLRFRAKSNYKRKYGHRQPFTKVKILSIK